MSQVKFIDLFCGVGGIRLGMESAGFKCVFSCDTDRECARTYEENFGERPLGDIREIKASDIPSHDILCAGFPCQPFSIAGGKKGFADTRGTLFFEITRVLEEKRPGVVFLENVKHLKHHDGGRTFKVITDSLESLGYSVSSSLLNGSDFGLPQNRERIIIVAGLSGQFDFGALKKRPKPALKAFLDSSGGFEWLDPSEYTLIENPKRQPSGLIFAGYRNKPIRKKGIRPGTERLSRAHRQPNRIYSTLGVHPALQSQESSGRFFILTDGGGVRKMTLSECWRIMGFPEDFKRPSPKREQYRQAGNSVCVPMVGAVALEIRRQFF